MSEASLAPWWRKDSVVFAVLVLFAALGFGVTFAVTSSYRHREDSLARHWYQAGQQDLTVGKNKTAITAFRTALLYSRDNPQYRLRLAQALAANGQTEQAVAYFLNLWEEQPGNGLYNLELARLRARENRVTDAARYYQGAIYGIWPEKPTLNRRIARVEYIRFLKQQNLPVQAQAEAISLAASVPASDYEGRLQAADLLLKTGDPQRALDEFSSLQKVEPTQAPLGAGRAAFALGRFTTAERYLQTALQHGASPEEAQPLLEQSRLVLQTFPRLRRLSGLERGRRVSNAFDTAGKRLQNCAISLKQTLEVATPTTDLQQLYADWIQLEPDTTIRKLAKDPDTQDAVMDLVFRIEETTARECGAPTGADWALLMMSRFGDEVGR